MEIGITSNTPVMDKGYLADDAHGGGATKKSGLLGASFNFINSIVGAGIIGLPFALHECGFWAGCLAITLVAYLTKVGVDILIDSGTTVNALSYEGLALKTLGKGGKFIVQFFMFIMPFGAMCAYLIIIADTLPKVFSTFSPDSPFANRNAGLLLCAFLIVLPVSSLRHMSNLSITSLISFLAHVVIVIVVVFAAGPSASSVEKYPPSGIQFATQVAPLSFFGSNFFAGLGAITFAFVCHHSSFVVYTSMKEANPANWHKVSHASVWAAFVSCLLMALGGYLWFYHSVQSDILNNFTATDVGANVSRVMLALGMCLTYPVEMYVARYSLIQLVHMVKPIDSIMPVAVHYVSTFLLFAISLIIACSVNDVGIVLELTGAFAASFLGYILPAVIYFKVNDFSKLKEEAIGTWKSGTAHYKASFTARMAVTDKLLSPLVMLILGCIAMIVGTVNCFTKK